MADFLHSKGLEPRTEEEVFPDWSFQVGSSLGGMHPWIGTPNEQTHMTENM